MLEWKDNRGIHTGLKGNTFDNWFYLLCIQSLVFDAKPNMPFARLQFVLNKPRWLWETRGLINNYESLASPFIIAIYVYPFHSLICLYLFLLFQIRELWKHLHKNEWQNPLENGVELSLCMSDQQEEGKY